jgi:PKD repeat protein
MHTIHLPLPQPGLIRPFIVLSILFTLNACGGGANGAAGINGLDAALRTSLEPAGTQCAGGGTKVESGLDADRNGTLDSSEVTVTSYVCNGSPGSAGPAGAAGIAGATGAVGTVGAAGAQGATGAIGPAGATGGTGPAGTVGAVGATGPAGTSGTNAAVPTSFNAPPAARVALAVSGLVLSVNAAASSDTNGTITSYAWNYGEPSSASNSASGITASHTYAAPGSYLVTLLVTDNQGAPAVNQQTITVLAAPVALPVATGKLNDTGITANQCYQPGSNQASSSLLISCTSAAAIAVSSVQDGMQGRDVAPASNSATDGKLGFSFTKIGASGESLPASATAWSCIKDNVTGLVWEVKTNDGGLRDWIKTYTNYDSTTSAQVYNLSTNTTNNPTQTQIDAATNSIGFKNVVNARGLCGAADWRLPTADELQGLVDYGVAFPGPTIDATWFPNTQGSLFWSSSPYVGNSAYAWHVNFGYGDVYNEYRDGTSYVRLVRAGQ